MSGETKFDINVAFVGNGSVGKSTCLNGVFKSCVSEMSWKRTTAAQYDFIIELDASSRKRRYDSSFAPGFNPGDQLIVIDDFEEKKDNGHQGEHGGAGKESNDKKGQERENIYNEVCKANSELSRVDGPVERKVIPVKLEMDTFFGGKVATRQDTQITLTDLPGLDDEEKQDLYQKHIEDNWMQYDCVVVVLDVGQAHNAKNILNFVNNNCKNCANSGVPVIILVNKVDSPKNTSLQGQVAEIYRKVEEVFQVKDRETALTAAMEGAEPDYPLVIPVSAQNAFLYLYAKNMSKDMFKKLPLDMIEEVGSAECGAFNWQEATTEQKYLMAYEKLSLEKLNRKRLDETNFDTFLDILSMTICGAEAQGRLINKKIDATLKSLNASKNDLIAVLRDVYDKKIKLGQPTESLAACFWSSYKVLQEQTFKELEVKGPSQVHLLAELVENLLKFHDFADPLWDGQHQIIKDKMKEIVVFQMKLLRSKFLARGLKRELWALEASQWNNIFHCFSVNFGDRVFSEHFQNDKFDMEDLIDSLSISINSGSNGEAIINSTCNGRAELPQSFKDPHHWGYVAWRFCQFTETLKMRASI